MLANKIDENQLMLKLVSLRTYLGRELEFSAETQVDSQAGFSFLNHV